MTTPAPEACRTCPWLKANHGRRHPDGWFTAANRRRLWSGLRRGEMMSCHRTDPANPVSDRAVAAGFKRVPAGTEPRECVGATILVQREMTVWQDQAKGLVSLYRKLRPRGLTKEGIVQLALRLAFGGVPIIGGRAMLKPDLDDPHVDAGIAGLDWTPITPTEGTTPCASS